MSPEDAMTEHELWLANCRAISKRARKYIEFAHQAQQEHRLSLAYARDAMPTPLEAAYAANALDECQTRPDSANHRP